MTPEEFLRGCSLEITAKDLESLGEARASLPLETAISITYLPTNSIDELIASAAHVRRLGFTPVPHISARRVRSRHDLERFLRGLETEAQIDRAFIIGGDPDSPVGPFGSALEVIETGLLSDIGVTQVGIAGYPEGHPKLSPACLRDALHDKLQCLSKQGHSAEIVTQFVFDSDPVLNWLAALRQDGVETPVRIGIPGPATLQSLLRFAARCGVAASTKALSKYGVSLRRLMSTTTPDQLVQSLAGKLVDNQHGRVGSHLYPFGGLGKTALWLSRLAVDSPTSSELEPESNRVSI